MNSNNADVYGIGIESSCDESGMALVKNGVELLANPLFSQIDLHQIYGGVIPEIASRAHLEKLPLLFTEIRQKLKDVFGDEQSGYQKISYVAVTTQPGLSGSLLIGYVMAQAFADFLEVPLLPIHHLEAHFYASMFEYGEVSYPFLGVLISGGNTLFVEAQGVGNIKVVGDTLDDACGEALDKAASILNLGYPGGPIIEKKAKEFLESIEDDPADTINREKLLRQNPLPLILKDKPADKIIFSYSGIKTALNYYFRQVSTATMEVPTPMKKNSVAALAYYFQERVFEIILRNLNDALTLTKLKKVIVAGGVAANSTLKNKILNFCQNQKMDCRIPKPAFCTDNAAMIAACGYAYYKNNQIRKSNKVSSQNDF